MPGSCWVPGCGNRGEKNPKLGFFAIPKIREHEGDFTKALTEDRRRLWLKNINRESEPTKYSKICSKHFISGRPASIYERSHPDWAPTVNLEGSKIQNKQAEAEAKLKRYQRLHNRRQTRNKQVAANAPVEIQDNIQVACEESSSPGEPYSDESLVKAWAMTFLQSPTDKS